MIIQRRIRGRSQVGEQALRVDRGETQYKIIDMLESAVLNKNKRSQIGITLKEEI